MKLPIVNSGKGILTTPTRELQLNKLLHVPKISYNLMFISKLKADKDVKVSFDKYEYQIRDNHTNLLLRGPCIRHLYTLSTNKAGIPSNATLSASTSGESCWHQRLGHRHSQIVFLISLENSSLRIPHTMC